MSCVSSCNYNNAESYQFKLGTVHPNFQAVKVGKSFSIQCFSEHKVEWLFNGRRFSVLKQDNRVIDISMASSDHFGNYTCIGQYGDIMGIKEFSDTAIVLVGRK